tara:strand:- start:422 stop:706 length:285 start_codon:yes stop_codon:yes gene_type:complete
MLMKLDSESKKVIHYLKLKDLNSFGYIKYSYFKRLITHVTNNPNNYELRKIFLYLLDSNYIIKKKNEGVNSYLYKFNNKYRVIDNNSAVTVYFD